MGINDKSSTASKKKNVQVVVRVRPLNEKEKGERSHLAIRTNGLAQTVSVKDRNAWKEFGPFDRVYSADSSQSTIYMDVVDPLVKEVIQGYNCTIFAYGQTGTGKTYTMEGEHDPNGQYTWQDDPRMGIIPRALMQIFNELDNQNVEEYSVRVSYVELYNEELNDLLNRSEQPQQRLRIYEDAVRKGSVIISGLEEVAVRERDEVYELLRRGAEKRKTASTYLNLTSSRSHSVFTVTVVIRENSMNGEELMKQGKLYLVDLAGSENIGRSGAIEMRAREAGNINQSLLTLGRVITALTSGAGHIPYRESKLTRILQDSLGGKTITTVIATLSPASSNIEESTNTLEYASSAKNIKNHPEINQKLSRRAILRQYNDELEKLKRDLQAARDKNGVYIDQENFDEMQRRLAEQTEQIDELTDKVGATMSQLQTLMQDIEMMDEHYARAYARCQHLTDKLKQRTEEIAALKLEMSELKAQLAYQKRAVAILQDAGDSLESQAVQLIEQCTEMSTDLERIHTKVDSLNGICATNSAQLDELRDEHEARTEAAVKRATSMNQLMQQQTAAIDSNCEYLAKTLESGGDQFAKQINQLRSFIDESMISMKEALNQAHNEVVADCVQHTDDVVESVMSLDQLNNQCENIFKTLSDRMNEGFAVLTQQHCTLCSSVEERRKTQEEMNAKWADERRKRLEEADKKVLQMYEVMKAMISESNVAIQEEFDQRHQVEQTFSDNQLACIKSGKDELTRLRDAVGGASIEYSEIENRFKSTEQSLRADIVNKKEHLIAQHDSMKSHVEQCSTLIIDSTNSQSEAMNRRVNDLVDMLKDVNTTVMDTANSMASSNETGTEEVTKQLIATHGMLDEFVCDKYQRAVKSGETPVRVAREFPTEAVEIPDADKLVKQWSEGASPKRRSFFRPRESLLEIPSNVLSPQTLKGVRPKLEDVPEMDDEQDSFEENTKKVTNVTKRRGLRASNK